MSPKYHIITYGCQMNRHDSERIAGILKHMGFVSTEDATEAEIVLINTCSVRQSAEDRIFGQVKNLMKLKKKKPELIIGITGCMPGRDRDGKIQKKIPGIDLYFPTVQATELPRWIVQLRPELVNSVDVADDFLKLRPDYSSTFQAFVTIQTGCNKFCTYCVVPFARGLEKNRSVSDIMQEVRTLAAGGCVEVTLLGQTVNSYVAPDPENFSKVNPYSDSFAALLWEINQVPGISRIHFTAPHPVHMNDQTIDAMALPAHVNFLHLPVQCGSNEILKRMNRRYTREYFLDVIRRVRERLSGIAIGTDIIVGFCGETPEQFDETVDLYKQADFDISYTARYSPRSGTAAWRAFKDDVSRDEKKRRWLILQELMGQTTLKKNQAFVGRVVSVLVDRHEPAKISGEVPAIGGDVLKRVNAMPGTCFGNSRELKLVQFSGRADQIGKVVDVKIQKADIWMLSGVQVF